MFKAKFMMIVLMAGMAGACSTAPNGAIQDTVLKVFRGADSHDWKLVHSAMADKVLLDYTSMAGGQPANLTPAQITGAWKGMLPGFKHTQHSISNFDIRAQGDSATAFAYGTAIHYIPGAPGGETWRVMGTYDFKLTRAGGTWKITAMKFNKTIIDGNGKLPGMALANVKAGKKW